MTNKTVTATNKSSLPGDIAGWFFGAIFLAIGLINTFWGNDAGYGIFVVLLALFFLPPVQAMIKKITGFTIPLIVKILLAVFILWSALGVGELFAKIDLMLKDLN